MTQCLVVSLRGLCYALDGLGNTYSMGMLLTSHKDDVISYSSYF